MPGHVVKSLEGLLGSDRLSFGAAIREQHGRDESYHADADGIFPPQVVILPRSTAEVSEIVKICSHARIPIIPSGACTSLEGHIAALRGGVALNMREMNKILEVNQEDMDVRVQAGVTRIHLNEYLRDTGLFFPIDPGADASIGGMLSTRASGTNAVRYGTMRDNALSLEAVMADGSIISTGSRARKSSTGYDLTRLLIGSEGTLGIITEATIKLHGQPEAISAAHLQSEFLTDSVNATICIIQSGIPVARIELLDEKTCAAVKAQSKLELEAKPTLFFEFHGESWNFLQASPHQLAGEICKDFGGSRFKWAGSAEERTTLWKARHQAYYSIIAQRPGCKGMPTDACVPISRLAECIEETEGDMVACGLAGSILGHVGDGNFHCILVLDPNNQDEIHAAHQFAERLARRAIRMGGTCRNVAALFDGEHGVGYGKLKFMEEEYGPAAIEVMRSIKKALDPLGILNPGKMGS
ncbi:hypothetical protein GUITHDRAFT_72404 [Guillardia theta CCMP2712]|uniref:D-lactate dehydrogenase (cytochrome) n=1 Tax=Guillardia theta (strain CCMP2712) TaxID=905079 RepID=L1J825_GUITC|nr:hypothetical protein GUITHDRAFT_72404 [Guillardia theta CCMP2712]EKX44225.1 hypothetical protein GUITHDRAFT_72404 [Guillardia theta CCMP2712]|eukprot:XP_005831205.1 hypothetical protein GUITHDRAFT_72404 [Guillardia theta CCMP2712]